MTLPTGEPDFWGVSARCRRLGESELGEQGATPKFETILQRVKVQNVARQATEEGLLDEIRTARRLGQTWRDIGLTLGMTKQGAQQRFGPRLGDGLADGD